MDDKKYQTIAELNAADLKEQPLYGTTPSSNVVDSNSVEELFLGQVAQPIDFFSLVQKINESKKAVEKANSDVENVGFFRSFIDKLFGLGGVDRLNNSLTEAKGNLSSNENAFFEAFAKDPKSFFAAKNDQGKTAAEAFAAISDSRILLKLVKNPSFSLEQNQESALKMIESAVKHVIKVQSLESNQDKTANLSQVFDALYQNKGDESLRVRLGDITKSLSGYSPPSILPSQVHRVEESVYENIDQYRRGATIGGDLSSSSSTDPNPLAKRDLPPLPGSERGNANSVYATIGDSRSTYETLDAYQKSGENSGANKSGTNIYDDQWNNTSFANNEPIYSVPNKSGSNLRFSVENIAQMAGNKVVHSQKSGNSYYYVNANIDQQDRVLVVKAKEGRIIGAAFRENVATTNESGKWQLTANAPFESPVMLNRVSSLQPWSQDLSAAKPSNKEPSTGVEHPNFSRLIDEQFMAQSGSRAVG